jgi:putative hemolysin
MAIEILILIGLILVNGFFAMAELAVLSSRKARLQQRAEKGSRGAGTALATVEEPTRFLSTVQIGITSAGILAGVFGGATIAEELSLAFEKYSWLAPYSETLGAAIVVIITTYLTLVIGELVPKRLALNNSEKIAVAIAPFMQFLSRLSTPLVSILSISTNTVMRLLGVKPSDEPPISEDEIKIMIEQGTDTGVFEETEQDILERVFRLNDRPVSSLMTSRLDIDWLDVENSIEENMRKVIASGHTNFVVCKGDLQNIVGIARSKDLLAQYVQGKPVTLMSSIQLPPIVPEKMKALDAVELMRNEKSPFVMVIDEYGTVEGMFTFTDVLEAIVGDIPGMDEVGEEPEATQREDGSWLLDGRMAVDDLQVLLDLDELPAQDSDYDTVAGFILSQLRRIPVTGDHFEWKELRFEVIDMDGRRVDKVLVTPLKSSPRSQPGS